MKTPPPNVPPVPEGFEYFGKGPLPFPSNITNLDVLSYVHGWAGWKTNGSIGNLNFADYALRIGSEIHRKNMPKPEEVAAVDQVAACDAWVKLFVELGSALGMTSGTGNDVLAEVRRRVQAHSEVVAAFDVAKSALAIVRKERDEKAEQLQIALKENKMLSNAIRNAANVEANLSKP